MTREEEIKRLLLDSTLSFMEYKKALNEYIEGSANLTFKKALCRAQFVATYGDDGNDCFIFFDDDPQPFFKVSQGGSFESVRRYCNSENIKVAKWKIGVEDVKKM